ncbi:MAG: hypothetical protein CENE_02270 [Candidatus Celerinatantimonas neptuna]|nr:MAG: hypothetical protein CENE_02270 [Candidatus Celerinatantimonas neptuna]
MRQSDDVFNYDDLVHLLLGAHFYACGGGGALANGQSLLDAIVKHSGCQEKVHITVTGVDALDDHCLLPVLAAIGAPALYLEKGYGQSPLSAFDALQKLKNVQFSCLSPIETGPIAIGMSLLVAAYFGIPVLNGDGGGRAFPCLQLSTFSNPELEYPIAVSPAVITSENELHDGGASVSIECSSGSDMDAMIRGIISHSESFDHRASLAAFVMTGRQAKQDNAVVSGTLTRSLQLGRSLAECTGAGKSCFQAIEQQSGAQCVMRGQLTNITLTTRDGFDWVTLEYCDHRFPGTKYTVIAQNENMLLWSDSLSFPLAMAPDLICCLCSDATLMSNDEIYAAWHENPDDERFKNMAIFTLPGAPQIQKSWFHDHFARIFKRFGYYGCYHPLHCTREIRA